MCSLITPTTADMVCVRFAEGIVTDVPYLIAQGGFFCVMLGIFYPFFCKYIMFEVLRCDITLTMQSSMSYSPASIRFGPWRGAKSVILLLSDLERCQHVWSSSAELYCGLPRSNEHARKLKELIWLSYNSVTCSKWGLFQQLPCIFIASIFHWILLACGNTAGVICFAIVFGFFSGAYSKYPLISSLDFRSAISRNS